MCASLVGVASCSLLVFRRRRKIADFNLGAPKNEARHARAPGNPPRAHILNLKSGREDNLAKRLLAGNSPSNDDVVGCSRSSNDVVVGSVAREC